MRINIHQIHLFGTIDGKINLDVRLQDETMWLSREWMSGLFNRDRPFISKHINNICKEGELDVN